MEISSVKNQESKKIVSNTAKAATIGAGVFGTLGALSNHSLQKDIIRSAKLNPGCTSIRPLVLGDSKLLQKSAEMVENLSKKIIESGNKIVKSEIVKSGLKSAAQGAAIVGGIALLVNLVKNANASKNTENK